MKIPLRISNTVLLWTLFVVGNPTQGQQAGRPSDSIIIDTDLVVTSAQITRRNDGSPVRGLGADDFLLREEGKQQQISLIKEDQPLSVVILVDGMGCLYPPELEFHLHPQAASEKNL